MNTAACPHPRYALTLQGELRGDNLKSVHDALQLEADCGDRFVAPAVSAPAVRTFDVSDHPTAFRVDPAVSETGSDEPAVFRTVAAAVAAAAEVPAAKRPVAIVLKGGAHYLDHTLELVAGTHDNLTFVSAPGERAVMTGAMPLKLSWAPFKIDATGANIYVADVGGQVDAIDGLRVNGKRAIRARWVHHAVAPFWFRR